MPVPARDARRLTVAGVVAAALVAILATAACAGTAAPGAGRAAGAASVASQSSARAAACRAHGRYVWRHLGGCGWAGPTTTGPRLASCRGHRLTALGSNPRGVITLDRPGQVVRCRKVTGCLSIEAAGVRLVNVAVTCTSGETGEDANGTGAVKVQDGASARLSRVRINGMDGVHACVWHQGARISVDRMDCSHVDDGVFSWSSGATGGNDFSLTNSYLHDFTVRTANGHIDGYQTMGAAHGRIVHNTFLMTSDDDNGTDSAVAIWNTMRDSSDITISRNLVAGGGFAVYAEDRSPSEESPAGGYSVSDVRITGNVFSRHLFGCVGYWGVWYPRGRPTDGWQRSGNRILESGQDIDGVNPSYAGHSCT